MTGNLLADIVSFVTAATAAELVTALRAFNLLNHDNPSIARRVPLLEPTDELRYRAG
jgi:hypothetical protein